MTWARRLLALSVLASLAPGCKGDDEVRSNDLRADGECRVGQQTGRFPRFCGRAPRNVIMISIDTLRAEWVTPEIMPFVSKLSDQGLRLRDHAQCSNWTYAGTTCAVMGRDHLDEGFIPKLSASFAEPMPDGTPFLATWLAEAGLYGFLVSANSWFSSDWNNDQGYAFSYTSGPRVPQVYAMAENNLDQAQRRGEAEDFFLHIHVVDPHAPYNAAASFSPGLEDLPPLPEGLILGSHEDHYDALGSYSWLAPADQALLEAHLLARYRGELRYTDQAIAEVFDSLDAHGWLDDALVVLWSDHGEAFWRDHGYQTHAYTLYGEENDGFALFWARNMVPAEHLEPTMATDIVPTVLDILGLPIPPQVTGFPVGLAPAGRVRRALSYGRLGVIQSVELDGRRLQYQWRGNVVVTDRNVDPTESVDLSETDEALTRELWAEMEPLVERADALIPEKAPIPVEGLSR